MFKFIKSLFADVKSIEGGVRGRLASVAHGIETDVARIHSAIDTFESGLAADVSRAESEVVREAARLSALIHGSASPAPSPSVAQAPAKATHTVVDPGHTHGVCAPSPADSVTASGEAR